MKYIDEAAPAEASDVDSDDSDASSRKPHSKAASQKVCLFIAAGSC